VEFVKNKNKTAIQKTVPGITPGRTFFLNLRFFGEEFYDTLQDKVFPNAYHEPYYFECVYGLFPDTKQLSIEFTVAIMGIILSFNGWHAFAFGQAFELPLNGHLVTAKFALENPLVFPAAHRKDALAFLGKQKLLSRKGGR
jgi:hypothetical protein